MSEAAPVSATTLSAKTSMFENGYTVKSGVDIGRFVFAAINFVTTMVFVLVLLGHAFQMDSITGNQVFHANRVLQSFSDTPPPEIDSFIKKVYGTNTEVVQMVDEITNLPRMQLHAFQCTLDR